MKTLMLAIVMVGVMSNDASAQPQDIEFTPGPRMIRAIEQLAGHYAHLGRQLGLTTEQKEAMAGLVQRIKTQMWMKEIETDELNLFIETLADPRGVLTADQQAKLRAALHPTMGFRLSQGFNTKIGLMSLEGIGRVSNGYRDQLRLTEAQAQVVHSLLEGARREVLRCRGARA
jgi:hypothetical protein